MQLVSSWNSALGHIVEDEEIGPHSVKTRCGRTLKNYRLGKGGAEDCARCGTAEEFKALRDVLHQKWAEKTEARKAANEETRKRNNKRLKRHRGIMDELQEILKSSGADITKTNQAAAGGSIEFEIEGLAFKLSGNIWQ